MAPAHASVAPTGLLNSTETPALTLAGARLRESVVVTEVRGERRFRRRLMELGLVPGTAVRVINVAPLRDPLEIEVRGCRLSIRRVEADAVSVRR